MGPAARSHGPLTSTIAAEKITNSGTRRRLVEIVSHLVKLRPGQTSAELSVLIHGKIDRHSMAKRLADAKTERRVMNSSIRKCSVTGHAALTWVAYDEGAPGWTS